MTTSELDTLLATADMTLSSIARFLGREVER